MVQTSENSQTDKLNWPTATQAITTILQTHTYASKRLHYICRIISILIVLTMLSCWGTYLLWKKPSIYKYILTDQNGQILEINSLNEPIHPDSFVIDWTIDSVSRLYSIDYVNFRNQLQSQRHNLTTRGWKNYQEAMKSSGNFQAILGNQYFITAMATGEGEIVKTGTIQERFAWKVKFPFKIIYQTAKDLNESAPKKIIQNVEMSVTVVRVPRYLNIEGLGIRAIIAEQEDPPDS